MLSGADGAAVTVAAVVAGSSRSQVCSCRPGTVVMAAARARGSGAGGSARISARSALPTVRAYQATPCRHPVGAPRGNVVAPSRSTAAPGAVAAKSSLGQPGVPASVASITSTGTPLACSWRAPFLLVSPGCPNSHAAEPARLRRRVADRYRAWMKPPGVGRSPEGTFQPSNSAQRRRRVSVVSAVPDIMLDNGNTIPQFGFGVFQIKPADTAEAVATALQAGYRHIDTADVFVTSKLSNACHRPDDARSAFGDSLKALGFDYIDLFLIHWPLPTRYDGDYVSTWKALEEFYRDGRARSIGVSNFQRSGLCWTR